MKINQAFRKMIESQISDIHTSAVAKIDSYDAEEMRADVNVLSKVKLEDEMVEIPLIVNAPVSFLKAGGFYVRPPYEKDDVVLIVFGEKAIDKMMITGEIEDPKYKRRHSLDDAMIVGGLQIEQADDLNSEYTSDLLFENEEEKTRIVMKKNGDIMAENEDEDTRIMVKGDGEIYAENNVANVKINLDIGGNINIIANNQVIVDASEVFLGSSTADEGLSLGDTLKEWLDGHSHPSDGSPPSSPSPDPSEKVMTE